MTIKNLDGDKVAVSAEAMQKVSATLPRSFDEIALDASRIIMHAVRGGPMIGGDTQLQARIQCIVIEACERAEPGKPAIVPGVMRCAKCKFQLTRTNLHINSGTSSAGDSKTEPCPNKCGPLWPVTWEQYATQAWEVAERYFDELQAMRSQGDRLIALLKSIRPVHGAVGSRDIDVTRQQKEIDTAIELLNKVPPCGN